MVQLTIALSQFRRYVKIRYPFLVIIFIFLIFFLPYQFDLLPDLHPVQSIISDGEYGHSALGSHLAKEYEIKRNVDSVSSMINQMDSKTLMIIIAPDYGYTSDEMEILGRFARYGGNILVIGTNEETINLLRNLDVYLFNTGRLFDRENNFGNSSMIKVRYKDIEFLSVIPFPLESVSFNYSNTIQTYDTAIDEYAIQFSGSPSEFIIGSTSKRGTNQYWSYVSTLLDNWNLNNKYVDIAPENLEFISSYIKDIGDFDKILFDESKYDYLPLNKEGVSANYQRYIKINQTIIVFTALILIFSLILGNRTGLLSNTSKIFRDQKLSKKISERLETLHLKNVPAVPLTEEERYLTENRLEMLQRGSHYFKYLLARIDKYIQEENLEIDSEVQSMLEFALTNIISKGSYWALVERLNKELKIAEKRRLEVSI